MPDVSPADALQLMGRAAAHLRLSDLPQEFAAILKADQAKWGKVIRELGIRE